MLISPLSLPDLRPVSKFILHRMKFGLLIAGFVTDYVGGFLGATLHGLPVECKPVDLALFNPPAGQTCLTYAGEWVTSSGGYLVNPNATTDCK
jgi:ABC-type multidrug transport system permease subunit